MADGEEAAECRGVAGGEVAGAEEMEQAEEAAEIEAAEVSCARYVTCIIE
jgi:hypothetical protein